jgi:hypothetical protein
MRSIVFQTTHTLSLSLSLSLSFSLSLFLSHTVWSFATLYTMICGDILRWCLRSCVNRLMSKRCLLKEETWSLRVRFCDCGIYNSISLSDNTKEMKNALGSCCLSACTFWYQIIPFSSFVLLRRISSIYVPLVDLLLSALPDEDFADRDVYGMENETARWIGRVLCQCR